VEVQEPEDYTVLEASGVRKLLVRSARENR